jgi:DUF4097 and DUF4098 domain-containing protein YvlB
MASPASGQSEQLVIRLTNPGVPGHLAFDNPKGSVKITGYDGQVILVNAVQRFSGNGKQGNTGMHKIERKAFDISAEEKNNQVSLVCMSNNKTVDFDIKIPRKFSLKVSSFDNGKIEIIHVSGNVEADNPFGDITLDNVAGSAVLNSVNGKIKAIFNAVDPASPMMFTSLEGNIELYFPEKVNANLKLRSENGDLFSEFNIKPIRRQTEVRKSVQGSVYSLEDWTVGMLNNGGPEYFVSTFNGNIYLKKYKINL